MSDVVLNEKPVENTVRKSLGQSYGRFECPGKNLDIFQHAVEDPTAV